MKADRRLRLAHPIKVQGVSTTSAVGQVTLNIDSPTFPPPPPGTDPTITSISRQVVSAAGGSPLTIKGTNFKVTSVVKLAGVACTMRYYDRTTINVLTPALPPSPKTNGYTLTVSNGSASVSLANAIDVVKTGSVTYARGDFDDGTLGTWAASGGSVAPSTDFAFTGTKSCKMISSGVDEDCLKAVHGLNPAFGPDGILTHYRLLLPQTTIDNVNNGGVSGQIKLHLYRDFAVGADSTRRHGIVLGIGPQFRGNQLSCFFDWNNVQTSGTTVDGAPFTNGATGLVFVANVWNEILLEQSTDGLTGRARLWLNGKRIVNQTSINMITGSNVNDDTPYTTKIGICYTENGIGPLTVYVDDTWVGDGVPSGVVLGAGEGNIGYNPATDTLVKSDSMQYAPSAETSSQIGPWHKLQSPRSNADVTPYTITLDPTGGDAAYPIAVRADAFSVQQAITNGTWSCAGDADLGLEGGMFGAAAGTMGDDAVGGQGGYGFWFSWRGRWPVGFRFSAFDPTTLIPNCLRMFNIKTLLIFREAFGGAAARLTFSSGVDRNGAELNGDVNVDWPQSPAQLWIQDIGPTPTSQKPSPNTSARYGQTMNNQIHGVDKSPNGIADNQIHEFVFYYRNESVEDVGDGAVKIYVDNYQIYDVDGSDPDNAAYLKAYTRVKAYKSAQWFATWNAGSPTDQSHWLCGPFWAWLRGL